MINQLLNRVFTASLLLVLILPVTSGFAQELAVKDSETSEPDLKTVLDNTAVLPPAKVLFREHRHNPMLKEPMILTGYLEYLAPGHLRKVIETPFSESFTVNDGKIEIQQGGKSKRLSLNKSKPLQAMLGGIEAVLAGQTEKLADTFDYDLAGSECDWTLTLVPKSKKIASHLSAMSVRGDDSVTQSIRIDQNDNEWSLMEILNESAPQ